MPHVGINTFAWDELDRILAMPATELTGRLAPSLQRKDSTYLPRAESELVAFLRSLLASEDWYAGRSPREAMAIDEFLDFVFTDKILSKGLKMKWLHEFRRGIQLEVFKLATGEWVVDDRTNKPRNKTLFIHWQQAQEDYDPSSELSNLGSRPFRHPSWDRKAAWELARLNNPFLHGAEAAYFPEYSIHSPEQVEILRREVHPARARLQRELDRVKSKHIRSEAMANFEEDLVKPIEQAASLGLALIAGNDH
jgi:hypothetical protein